MKQLITDFQQAVKRLEEVLVYADKVYSHLPRYLQLFQGLSDRLSKAA